MGRLICGLIINFSRSTGALRAISWVNSAQSSVLLHSLTFSASKLKGLFELVALRAFPRNTQQYLTRDHERFGGATCVAVES